MSDFNKLAYAPGKSASQKLPLAIRIAAGVVLLVVAWLARTLGVSYGVSFAAGAVAAMLVLVVWECDRRLTGARTRAPTTPSPATVPELHQRARNAGGGAYLAHSAKGSWISGRRRSLAWFWPARGPGRRREW